MSVLLTGLLDDLQAYGYPVLALAIFVAAVGVPLPVNLALLAVGAFAAEGDFNFVLVAVVATLAAVLGDSLGYFIGWRWGRAVLLWAPRSRFGRRFISVATIERSQRTFGQHGGWAIFLTRFLLTPLGGVTNLVAGSEVFPVRSFLFWDVTGEALGALIPLALGFAFGASWEAIGDILGDVSLVAIGVTGVGVCAYVLVRSLRVRRPHTAPAMGSAPPAVPGTDSASPPYEAPTI